MTTQNLLKSDLLLNIDEWSLSNNTKAQRSWNEKGKNFELKSIIFQSSISIISWVAYAGWHFSHLHNSTIDSNKLVEFFSDLLKFIKSKRYDMNRRLILIMDNATIHKSQSTNAWMKDKFDLVLFLPPYTLQYAPVEHFFSAFKRNILRSWREIQTNLKSEMAKIKIKDALWGVKQEHIINMFCHCFRQMKLAMMKFLETY